jgi:hypothetical protein
MSFKTVIIDMILRSGLRAGHSIKRLIAVAYVVANHSKKFWWMVGTTLPDFADRKEWLRMNGRKLRV